MTLAFTPGEPAGIGPDLAVMLAQHPREYDLVAFADPELLRRRAARLGLPLRLTDPGQPGSRDSAALAIQPIPLQGVVSPGQLTPNSAAYVLESIREATMGCLEGKFSALVTGPIHKGIINEAGAAGLLCHHCGPQRVAQIPFSGHTEYLQALCEADEVVMMLSTSLTADTPPLRVALVTTHLPLAAVPSAISRDKLQPILRTLHRGLGEHFNLPDPTLLVAGLNPHAGEAGHLGREEIEVIEPVLEHLRQEGMKLIGPLPADTLFTPATLRQGDVAVAMYHDQGLPVLKHRGFGNAVNITLGLPFLRVSVDHGTALDLAGTGQASLGSLQQAITTALQR